jgi:hypothetical protein
LNQEFGSGTFEVDVFLSEFVGDVSGAVMTAIAYLQL